MTPEQVQFCYAIVQGKLTSEVPSIDLLPKIDVFKNSDFKFYPGIFALWAYRQSNAEIIVKKLQQLFPNEPIPEGLKPVSIQMIQNRISEAIFPLIKSSLFPFLQNIAKLAGARPDSFNIIAAENALTVILDKAALEEDPFSDLPPCTIEIIQKVLDKITLIADRVRSEQQLCHHHERDLHTPKRSLPDVVRDLLTSMEQNAAPTPKNYVGDRAATYLPSNVSAKSQNLRSLNNWSDDERCVPHTNLHTPHRRQ